MGARNRFRPLVLCYHAVSDHWQNPLSVRAASLENHLEGLLRRRYRPATIDAVTAGAGRIFHVTFDDAFRSVLTALPALDRLRVPATVFVCTSFADTGRMFPLPDLAVGAGTNAASLATLTWQELNELAARGITIGSHTMSHPHLPDVSDAQMALELSNSRHAIEAFIGRPCRYLAYPFGEHDARVRAAARAAGYAAAFALPGRDRPIDAFALPRIGIWRREGALRVALKTSIARPSSPVVQWALRSSTGLTTRRHREQKDCCGATAG
jgi:peptidoglycan/xylan/chitin deacetylase (PgdA/CDA1 family)